MEESQATTDALLADDGSDKVEQLDAPSSSAGSAVAHGEATANGDVKKKKKKKRKGRSKSPKPKSNVQILQELLASIEGKLPLSSCSTLTPTSRKPTPRQRWR